MISIAAVGGAFLLRAYTVRHLPLWTGSNVVALAMFPEDRQMMEHRMPEILGLQQVRSQLKDNESYVVYFLPTNYVMQGLIADTGGDWQLYKKHHSLGRFVDWIFHPFSHLGGGTCVGIRVSTSRRTQHGCHFGEEAHFLAGFPCCGHHSSRRFCRERNEDT
jgi:hypothetical protein